MNILIVLLIVFIFVIVGVLFFCIIEFYNLQKESIERCSKILRNKE